MLFRSQKSKFTEIKVDDECIQNAQLLLIVFQHLKSSLPRDAVSCNGTPHVAIQRFVRPDDTDTDILSDNDPSVSVEQYSKLFMLTFLFYNASIDLVHFELNNDSISALPTRGATRRFIPELSSEASVSISGEMIFGKKDDNDNALVRAKRLFGWNGFFFQPKFDQDGNFIKNQLHLNNSNHVTLHPAFVSFVQRPLRVGLDLALGVMDMMDGSNQNTRQSRSKKTKLYLNSIEKKAKANKQTAVSAEITKSNVTAHLKKLREKGNVIQNNKQSNVVLSVDFGHHTAMTAIKLDQQLKPLDSHANKNETKKHFNHSGALRAGSTQQMHQLRRDDLVDTKMRLFENLIIKNDEITIAERMAAQPKFKPKKDLNSNTSKPKTSATVGRGGARGGARGGRGNGRGGGRVGARSGALRSKTTMPNADTVSVVDKEAAAKDRKSVV